MPSIVDYEQVLSQASRQQLRCLYHNSGAFGFPSGLRTWSLGWVGPEDLSIREEAKALVRQVAPPYSQTLAALATQAWNELAPGSVWLLPKSHWSYELQFGSAEWMPALLREAGVDPDALLPRNNAAAVAFAASEGALFERVSRTLLERLSGSDFALLLPGVPLLCTVHSHQQLWWTTAEETLLDGLHQLLPAPADPAPLPDPKS